MLFIQYNSRGVSQEAASEKVLGNGSAGKYLISLYTHVCMDKKQLRQLKSMVSLTYAHLRGTQPTFSLKE